MTEFVEPENGTRPRGQRRPGMSHGGGDSGSTSPRWVCRWRGCTVALPAYRCRWCPTHGAIKDRGNRIKAQRRYGRKTYRRLRKAGRCVACSAPSKMARCATCRLHAKILFVKRAA